VNRSPIHACIGSGAQSAGNFRRLIVEQDLDRPVQLRVILRGRILRAGDLDIGLHAVGRHRVVLGSEPPVGREAEAPAVGQVVQI
jgi:hypothetical protein